MKAIERHWYHPRAWLTVLLAPLEGLFAAVSTLRRTLYRRGVFRCERLPVPVVVIGNINVGGVGKTPLTLALIEAFRVRGVAVGVISRGYGGQHEAPTEVGLHSTAAEVGDEPLLMAAGGAPVVVGRDRVAAGRLLLDRHPEVQLILSDDGLQHYRLGRDLELVVLDGARGIGNGRLLPNGPLREAAGRLRSVDAIVLNGALAGEARWLPAAVPRFAMTLEPGAFVSLAEPGRTRRAADFAGERLVALAGIGHPERFFRTLEQLGLDPGRRLAFPDHHAFQPQDIPADADAVLVTAKDAVKLHCVNRARLWVLPVRARLAPDLADWILARLKIRHGR
ncbi:tetraacyldisaccharide 4'-kinase [Pseudogulbenkiania ferrooxidans]|uniref:Tetraacyldisaccharide 4'-kinase n=1 Tax=Pseudogulbenkiania ferrooxidans 2002 TaxID=279714 RepID=B9Z6I1_9NEIS|nr:tetraacyldisaccharide 4'-kinase [Pseudogulbenkiania ferrooxidans]EEG07556.1 tetraacyldisaccharide 4'-kinase [Pseudogulbenkiania ferrooxidans 2002]